MSEDGFEKGHPGPEWLSAWHDGELQGSASTAVQTHVESCPACRRLLDEFGQLDQAAQLGDDARPEAGEWRAIEDRLRFRLEDELSLGIPTGPTTPYIETNEALVLLPTSADIQAGKTARPFRLRWALATAAGLTVALLSLRMVTDRDWTVGKVINPAPVRMTRGPVAAAPASTAPPQLTTPPEAEVAAADESLGKIEATIAPRDYLAEVDMAIRKEAAINSSASPVPPAAPSDEKKSRDALAQKSDAAESMEARPITDPEYAMVFAAASRAREAGQQELARRGFEMVSTGIPEDDLARDAEYEAVLAAARMEIAAGGDPAMVSRRLANDAAAPLDTADSAQKPACRTALANLRTAMTLAAEQGRPLPVDDADARLQQLRSCARQH